MVITMAMAAIIAVLGAVGIIAPSAFLNFARLLLNPTALYVVAAVRILFGALLLWVASESCMPKTVRVIGIVIVVAGLLTPLFGVERSETVFNWWLSQDPLLVRAAGAVLTILGAFVIYVLGSGRRVAA
jgi:hypothetical protein